MTPAEKAEVVIIVIKRLSNKFFKWLIILILTILLFSFLYYVYNEADSYYADKEAKLKIAKEDSQRFCIAEDVKRMEKIVKSMTSSINEDENLKSILNKSYGVDGGITHPEDDIKESVLIYEIKTKCDSDFYLLVNIRADENDKLRWFSVWGQNSPKGYPDGLIEKFSINYEALRKLKENKVMNEDDQQSRSPHCAVGLSKRERLNRLAKFGAITQSSENNYRAGSHTLSFDYFGLEYCY